MTRLCSIFEIHARIDFARVESSESTTKVLNDASYDTFWCYFHAPAVINFQGRFARYEYLKENQYNGMYTTDTYLGNW